MHSAAGAGDVNGDGYSDVVIGQYGPSLAFVHFGNTSSTLARGHFRLYETNLTTPITAANIPIPQFGAGLFVRPFLGRSRTRLVWETRIQGAAFSTGSNGLVNNSTAFTAQQAVLTAGAVAGVELKNLVDKPGGGSGLTATKVRARVRYDPVTAITGQVFGPWRYMPGYQDGLGTHNNVPLPVELLRFDATCKGGVVELTWATGTEENSSHFLVQRSDDAINWTEVARVPAAGHSHQLMEYSCQDPGARSGGTIFYRLVQVDLDGETSVLPSAAAQPCARTPGIFFPNPTHDLVNVDLGESNGAIARIVILDALGRTVVSRTQAEVEGPLSISMVDLPNGSYTLMGFDTYGGILFSDRVVKQ
jgi:hypothetical protein